ncbi:helix-turn-helix transcriptional regulator [Actinoplanes sp. NPDC048796]|uniref:helix-turn-helix domain-containing protein n=1 Tax=unclassified Actinoplanes TaxID=2626549 RepID=UPI0033E56654
MSDVGQRLREWRTGRRMSQLELSAQAGVSARHLSFVETGRSRPTRDMILRLAEQLGVPLRSRNELLVAGGFAPAYSESALSGAPLAAILESLRNVLKGHEPYPALLVDRNWTMIDANAAVGPLVEGCAPWLLEPPVNVLRLSLHPDGLAPRIRNLAEWRGHILDRVSDMADLRDELRGYPGGVDRSGAGPVVPLRIDDLSFFSITSVLGTARDVTLSELAIESFLPADEATAAALHRR